MISVLEILPVAVFVLYLRIIDTSIPLNFQEPFVAAGALALVSFLVLGIKKKTMNRIFLGINIYLFTGGAAFITGFWWLALLYKNLQAAGMMAWIIITGFMAILFSSKGFIGADSPDKKLVTLFSFYLLFWSIVAFFISYLFRSNKILSELIPFMALFSIQKILIQKFRGKNQAWESSSEKQHQL